MCGIYGVVSRTGAADAGLLPPMDRALRHRGPDDTGALLDGACALGMRRLAIIDPGGGRQPIASEDRTRWVVFNGEIYNYRALRRWLQERGHHLATASDTEVLVHLHEELGPALLERLRGMFALALWDRREQALLLARDRLGIKPLYYAETDEALVFASELKGLLACPLVARRLDPVALAHYLRFGTTPADRAAIAGVRKLPPATLVVVREGRVVSSRRWWALRLGADGEALPPDEGAAAEEVAARLEDAVRCHLEADVEVGAFLSGGLDSSAVVAAMARAGARPHTFSIGFEEADFDELAYARQVAERYGTRHEELVVRPDAWALCDELIGHLDEPLADVSAIPTLLVSRLAARRVKVVLSGDGGDELFAGYDHHEQGLRDRRLDRLPWPLQRAMGALATVLPAAAPGKRWLRYAALPPLLRPVEQQSLLPPDLLGELLTPAARDELAALPDPGDQRAALLATAPGDGLGRLLWLDAMTYLPNDILTKVDRMSMACSLEVRPPLLDHQLWEAVARLPSRWKLGPAGRKLLLKRAVAGWLPEAVVGRRKQGFGVPIRAWFRGPLRHALDEVLLDRTSRERGLLRPRAVRALLDEHRRGRRDQSLRLWALLVLELWLRRTVDGAAPAAAPPAVAVEARHA